MWIPDVDVLTGLGDFLTVAKYVIVFVVCEKANDVIELRLSKCTRNYIMTNASLNT